MKKKIDFSTAYRRSENVVARDVGGEFVIIPITSDVGSLEDELYTLNETGRAIWNKLDGRRSLEKIAQNLLKVFAGSSEKDIRKDCLGFVEELATRKMVVESNKT